MPRAVSATRAEPARDRRVSSSVGRGIKVAYLPDPKKFGVQKGYPRPSVRDRLLEGGFQFERVTPEQIREGALQRESFGVLVVPGGYAPNFAGALGELGGRRIREFLSQGGGYVGICAGAYLGSVWGFDLIPVDILDIEHWARGKTAECHLRATPAGRRLLGPKLPDTLTVRYANGPLFEVLDARVEALLEFESQLRGKCGTYPPLMRGSPAAVAGTHGRGRVVLVSPHMEDILDYADIFRDFFRWAAGHELDSAHHAAAIVSLFQSFDTDGDGALDRAELAHLCKRLDESSWTDERVDRILQAFDANGDGRIQFAEFIGWLYSGDEQAAALRHSSDVPPPGQAAPASRGAAETDGEDTEMDVPALVRTRSAAEFERRGGPAGGELAGRRRCVSGCGCSGTQQEVPAGRVKESVVKIQQAVRQHGLTQKARPDSGHGDAEPASSSTKPRSARAKVRARAAASSPPPVPRAGKLLTRGSSDYVCWLQGPVLFTAPHSLKLVRGGGPTGERTRKHKRERWTAEIAALLSRELHRGGLAASLMVWNRAAGPARGGRLDPNYLDAAQFAASPWHRALHRWMLLARGRGDAPLLHVDLHGKVSEKLHLDLGTAPLAAVWPPGDQAFVGSLRDRLSSLLDDAMRDHKVCSDKGALLKVDADPRFHGYWGADTVTTISHQSVLLGVPAVQLEMPPRLRECLVGDPEFCGQFASAFTRAYHEVVVPWWSARSERSIPRPATLAASESLAAGVVEGGPPDAAGSPRQRGFESWSTQLFDELVSLERSTPEDQI